ncbi:MAG TPA: hypothetical protein VHG51_10895 [Longimicrobiaceae bacterium]|nr:hypothetical protein [Longimicrobiaceae bacterium]
MSAGPVRRALVLALAAVAACGGEEAPPPPPDPVPTPGVPVIPVDGERVTVFRVPPVAFEWPGGVIVTAPEPGTVAVEYTLDNPCRHVPRRALSSMRGDTVALVVTWPPVQPDSSRKCPQESVPDAFRIRLRRVPPGEHTFALFEAIEGQTAAALAHVTEVTVP